MGPGVGRGGLLIFPHRPGRIAQGRPEIPLLALGLGRPLPADAALMHVVVEIGLQGGEFSLDRVRVGTAGLPAISGGGRDFLDAVPVSPQPQDHAPGLAPLGAAHDIRSLHDRWPEMTPRESALQGDGEHATAWARLPRAYHRARQVDGGSPIFGPGDKGVVIPVDIPAVDQATTAVPGRDQ